jgi:hypothetical protein
LCVRTRKPPASEKIADLAIQAGARLDRIAVPVYAGSCCQCSKPTWPRGPFCGGRSSASQRASPRPPPLMVHPCARQITRRLWGRRVHEPLLRRVACMAMPRGPREGWARALLFPPPPPPRSPSINRVAASARALPRPRRQGARPPPLHVRPVSGAWRPGHHAAQPLSNASTPQPAAAMTGPPARLVVSAATTHQCLWRNGNAAVPRASHAALNGRRSLHT